MGRNKSKLGCKHDPAKMELGNKSKSYYCKQFYKLKKRLAELIQRIHELRLSNTLLREPKIKLSPVKENCGQLTVNRILKYSDLSGWKPKYLDLR